ncbi:MAG: hypothetical protein QF632_01835 [Candidatus Woesearchaeota archaeon]|nr:hypothetical protein [Candidatus Woesearchaeota archaeon]
MKLRKAIKKIVALGTGLSMVGATLLGASAAADLKAYPGQFIKDGVFNGVIVFGDTAAASDVAGSVDIATNLQYLAKVEVPVTSSGGASVSISGDAAQVKDGSDILELHETLYNVTEVLTKDDLNVLAQGTLDNSQGSFTYNQYIKFNDSSRQYVDYAIDDDDDEDIPADYLFVTSGDDIYIWELEFQEPAESDITDASGTAATNGNTLYDFEDEDIWLMGKKYSITKAARSAQNKVKLTLFGGDVSDTLEEGQTKTYVVDGKDYEVTALIIDDTTSTPAVKLKINGEVTRKLKEDQTDTLSDGIEVGIRNILGNEAGDVTQDLVEFYLGVDEIIFQDTNISKMGGGSLEVRDETISDATIEISGSDDNTKTKISKIKISLDADDDLYVSEGKTVSEQLDEPEGFFTLNFDIEFQGLSTADTSEVMITNSGDKQYLLSFENKDGDTIKFPLVSVLSSGDNRIGDDSQSKRLIHIENFTGVNQAKYPIADEDSFIVNDNKAIGVRQTGFTHVLQYKDQDSTNKVLKFKDVGTGETIEVSYTQVGDSSDAEIIVGGKEFKVFISADSDNSNISVDLDGSGSIVPSEAPYLVTKGGAYMNITINNTGAFRAATVGTLLNISIYVDSDEIDDSSQEEVLEIPISVSSTPELDLGTISRYAIDLAGSGSPTVEISGYQPAFQSGLHKVGTQDNREERTVYGILVEQVVDTQGPDELVLTVPNNQVEALVYVTANAPSISKVQTEGGSSVSSQVTPIALGTAKLASEVADVKAQNAIVVGGPCVNTAAATLLDNPTPCTSGFSEGKALVKLWEHSNGNVAMLIAGFSALDTRRAARVIAEGTKLAELDDGVMEVEVTGTTLTEATVSVPSPAVAEAPAADAGDAGEGAE